jgi:hypothetical protein
MCCSESENFVTETSCDCSKMGHERGCQSFEEVESASRKLMRSVGRPINLWPFSFYAVEKTNLAL